MKKLLFLSLLVLFSCSKGEEEEENRIKTQYVNRMGVTWTVVGGDNPLSSSPWLFVPYWSNETQISAHSPERNSIGNAITINRVECFSTWDLKLPEPTPEGYEFVRWEMEPKAEAQPIGEFPNYTKFVNCIDLNPDASAVMVRAVYLSTINY